MSDASLHRSDFDRHVEILKESFRQDRIDLSAAPPLRSVMAPQLAYGRHRGPVFGEARRAAVLIALYLDPMLGWVTPLTLRPDDLEHHPGQISFPGGRVEPNEGEEEAARREFAEELGVVPSQAITVGRLSPIFVYASHHLVSPFVAVMPGPSLSWNPDPREVAEVIEFPLGKLYEQKSKGRIRKMAKWVQPRNAGRDPSTNGICTTREGLPPADRLPEKPKRSTLKDAALVFETPAYEHSDHWIWGATAMMLHELSTLLPWPLILGGESFST